MKTIAKQISEKIGSHYSTGEVAAITRIIATELLGISQSTYLLKDDVTLTEEQETQLEDAISRLAQHEPLQYILGYSDFCGLRFAVTPATLIPRPETSELIEWITADTTGDTSILDIGTGSGCIAISLASKLKGATVTAWDISSEALAVARRNNLSNGTGVTFSRVDILNHTPHSEQFDIIVSNPPYIKELEKAEMEPNVLDWEPHTALFVPNDDPLLFYRTIATKGLSMLAPGGRLYFEINRTHGEETTAMLHTLGYTGIELRKDIADNDRMIKAIKSL